MWWVLTSWLWNVWRLCKVLTWLGWTTFPRIPFSVCFLLGEACREKVEMDHSGCSSHMVDYPLTHLIDEGQQLHLQLLHLFMNPPSACPTLKPRVYLTPRWSTPASPTGCPCHQGQRQWERTWVLAVLLDFSLSFPRRLDINLSFLTGLQASTTDKKTMTFQRFL